MTASGLRSRPDTGPRSSAVSGLGHCCLTVGSSNVFFCSRPIHGPAAGPGAGEDATAIQVLSAVLRSRIERPTLGRVLFKLPLAVGVHSARLQRRPHVVRVSRWLPGPN